MPKVHTEAGQLAIVVGNRFFDITASDTVDVENVGANFHVNKTGYYNIILAGDNTPTKVYLIQGMVYPYRIKRLMTTNTDNPDGLVGVLSVNED